MWIIGNIITKADNTRCNIFPCLQCKLTIQQYNLKYYIVFCNAKARQEGSEIRFTCLHKHCISSSRESRVRMFPTLYACITLFTEAKDCFLSQQAVETSEFAEY